MSHQRVREIMQLRPPSVAGHTTLSEVVELLLRHRLSGVPVVADGGMVIGFVSEHDCLHQLLMSSYHCEGAPRVDEVMHRGVLSVDPEDSIVDLAQRLNTQKPKVYPVVEGGRLVGLVTRTDVLKALADNRAECCI